MTLVIPLNPDNLLASLVTAGLPSLALRMPEHVLAQRMLEAFGGPLAAPSANPSGRVSPTQAQHVLHGLEGRIAAVVDRGTCSVGLESTIVALALEPTLLRPGGLSVEAIERCLGQRLARLEAGDAPTSPGQLVSHYAPKGAVRLDATSAQSDETLLGFGQIRGDLNLSISGDLLEAAANLFGALHELDRPGGNEDCRGPHPKTWIWARHQ